MHFLIPILLAAFQFHGRVQVHRQLQLQSVIDAGQVEPRGTALVVHHAHIDLPVLPAHIDPVDPALQAHAFVLGQKHGHALKLFQIPERYFRVLREEFSPFHLPQHGPGGTLPDPLHARQGILVSRPVRKNLVGVILDGPLQRFLHPAVPQIVRHMEPSVSALLHRVRKIFQRFVEHVSHIHSLQFTGLPFFQAQAVLQEMGIGAGRELFQARDAAFQQGSVQSPRHCFPDAVLLPGPAHRVHETFQFFSPGIPGRVPADQGAVSASGESFPFRLQRPGQFPQIALRRHQTVQELFLFRIFHPDLREQLPDLGDQKGRP